MVKRKTTKTKKGTSKKVTTRKKSTTTKKSVKKATRSKARQVYVAFPQTKISGKKYDKAKDKKLIAKKPGKRISKKGKVYYEYRVNRSDINKYY